ncbi:hypothetical protein [Longimicrobium terrae]|uniref:Uncharacterized protein n=1 Tax=Longimicrobium terrae TaxID=1639882 RepID=A0A841GNC2_9BACT|nr:hypothetical protein [Longimicrobium terrae]MBB4635915.1 hypothetical protein [Longimicrobium terrae]MBB6070311.1 hypothetical protein [Longimicrobium terrae]NNC30813.1 hypothetical protein [Longimicrobium terrae]
MADEYLEFRVTELATTVAEMGVERAEDHARLRRIVVIGFVAFAAVIIAFMALSIFMMLRCRT